MSSASIPISTAWTGRAPAAGSVARPRPATAAETRTASSRSRGVGQSTARVCRRSATAPARRSAARCSPASSPQAATAAATTSVPLAGDSTLIRVATLPSTSRHPSPSTAAEIDCRLSRVPLDSMRLILAARRRPSHGNAARTGGAGGGTGRESPAGPASPDGDPHPVRHVHDRPADRHGVERLQAGPYLGRVGKAEHGEDLQGALPGGAAGVPVAGRVLAIAQVDERLSLAGQVAELADQRDRPVVAGDGALVLAQVVVDVAEAVPGPGLRVQVAEPGGQRDRLLAVPQRLPVVAEQGQVPAQRVQRPALADLVA